MTKSPQNPFGAFGGVMPPSAEPVRRKWFTGVEMVPKSAALGAPDPSQQVGILEGRFDARTPLCLTIGDPSPGHETNFGWSRGAAYTAGIVSTTGAPFGGETSLRAACILEYGSGSQSSRVVFDWCPGSYNLPPCEFVRVSVLTWGTSWPLRSLAALATIAEGKLDGAAVPVLSATGALGGGEGTLYAYRPPSHAKAFEVANVDPTVQPIITCTGGVNATRDYAGRSVFPPWSPIEIGPQTDPVTIEANALCVAKIRWYLEL